MRKHLFVSETSDPAPTLRRNMTESPKSPNLQRSLQVGLDDLLSELQDARHYGELGRLALLAYCDVRSWARQAGEIGVAHHSTAIFTDHKHASKEVFLQQVDELIAELQLARPRLAQAESVH